MKKPLPAVNLAAILSSLNEGFAQVEKEAGFDGIAPSKNAAVLALLSEALTALESNPNVFGSVDDANASLLQTFIARQAIQSEGKVVESSAGLEAKFDSRDIVGWAGSLLDWLKGIRKHEFISHNDGPETIPNEFRTAILSDWGTGMYGAPVCAKSIQQDGNFNMVMHLGDVYYSGDIDEVEDRFLNYWPRIEGCTSRALNSNHEMYSGGHGYFERILPAFNQRASYFALQNDYWLLVGLDTGYTEHELHGDQASWINELIKAAGDRRVVLYSHHQPYSLFEKQGSKLVAQLGKLLEARRIHAWYWGHEHRCAIYDKHPYWGVHGRCIGHSGFPYFRDKFKERAATNEWQACPPRNLVPGCIVLDGPNPYVKGHEDKYGPNGYVVLEFRDRDLREIYKTPEGQELRNQLVQ